MLAIHVLQESGHLDAVCSVQQQSSTTASVTKPATGTISGMLADFSKALGELTEEHNSRLLDLCHYVNVKVAFNVYNLGIVI
jgi:hypothetical protein